MLSVNKPLQACSYNFTTERLTRDLVSFLTPQKPAHLTHIPHSKAHTATSSNRPSKTDNFARIPYLLKTKTTPTKNTAHGARSMGAELGETDLGHVTVHAQNLLHVSGAATQAERTVLHAVTHRHDVIVTYTCRCRYKCTVRARAAEAGG